MINLVIFVIICIGFGVWSTIRYRQRLNLCGERIETSIEDVLKTVESLDGFKYLGAA
jgi:hypothetical protein